MFPVPSSSSSYSLQNFHYDNHRTTQNVRIGYHSGVEEAHPDGFSKTLLSSSPMSSDSRPHSPHHSSSPSRHAYYRRIYPRSPDRYSSPTSQNSYSSPYAKRASSPLTPSSPPLSSPLTRFDCAAYHSNAKVHVVGREVDNSYFDDSRLHYRDVNEQSGVNLPSFRSLFGSNERKNSQPSVAWRIGDTDSYPSLDFDTSLPPLKFPPLSLKNFATPSIPSECEPRSDSHLNNSAHLLDNYIDRISTDPEVSHIQKTLFHSPCQTPARSQYPLYGVSTPQTPQTPESSKLTFFSPSKISPYPRRTFFLESSERNRTSPVRPKSRRDLLQLVEIADVVEKGLPEAKQPCKLPEETSLDSATSLSSSPAAYQSSLPPSSPPTSEAQLSPMADAEELPALTISPLTDTTMDALDLILDDGESQKSTELLFESQTEVLLVGDDVLPAVSQSIDLESTEGRHQLGVTSSGNRNPNSNSTDVLPSVTEPGHLKMAGDATSKPDPVSLQALKCDEAIAVGYNSNREPVVEEFIQHTSSVNVLISPSNIVSFKSVSDARIDQPTPSSELKQQKNAINSKAKVISVAPPIASSAPRVTVTVVRRTRPAPRVQRNTGVRLDKSPESTEKGQQEKDLLKTTTSEIVNSRCSTAKRPRGTSRERAKISEAPRTKKLKVDTEGDKMKTKTSASVPADVVPTTPFSASSTSPLVSPSTIPAKRKADDDTTKTPSLPVSKVTNKSRALPLLTAAEVKEIDPRQQKKAPVSSSFSSLTSTVPYESWSAALAAAYGSPSSHGSKVLSPKSKVVPKPAKKIRSRLQSDLSSGEEIKPKSLKMRSPRSKRMVVESDSEDDSEKEGTSSGSESELVKPTRLAQTRERNALRSTPDSDSDLSSSENDDDEQSEASSDEHMPSKPLSKSQKPKSLFPPLSALDLELTGIIIETMSLSRSSSHLASALYRTVQETRSSIFEKLLKAYPAHFRVATEDVLSKGLAVRNVAESSSRRGRSKRFSASNEEGDITGMSEEDIMWVSEFERVMKNCATKCSMFGMVESSFRNDPRDRPLPFSSRFFYVPDCDPDIERAQLIKLTMPGAGKRSETKKYKQYYWKPVGK
ncbi:hypothetical protein D9757_002611 [Collybiopsis confluens]|uniref:Uncharacterized protein n=1 Tax=Collybiopsis confluens TaxID=2823264 RepID=A0A8H5ME71_9AGAR|nr:hypothetical protein D9757_002611 [Collybiopsis confluens]